ncbi:RNA-processing protein, partial [archaeon]|nr:RNA-processing protein [archaeon]
MQTQDVKIPKARIAVLIGEKGSVKRRIEKKANVKLEIDSEEGDVIIEGDSLGVYETMNVVRAI